MRDNCFQTVEKFLKRNAKKKFSLNVATIVAFLIIGGGSFAENIVVESTGGEPIGKNYTAVGHSVIDDDLSITMVPASSTPHTYPKGMVVRGDSDVVINGNLNTDVTLASESNPGIAADSNATYGIAVGYANLGGAANKETKLTVKDATINVTNTPNTKLGKVTRSRTIFIFTVTADMVAGQQLSGIRVFRNGTTTGTSAKPTFESTGKLEIDVTDSSTAKIGDYLAGIYVSGDGATAILNDSNIKVSANGKNSAALKIGKPNLPNPTYAATYEGSSIHSKGNMILDTTDTKDSASIRLFGDKSSLIADYDTSSGEIKSANSAIVYDVQDYTTQLSVNLAVNEDVSRNENGSNQVVRLKDTVINTTSETASLIKARAINVEGPIVDLASGYMNEVKGWFNTGAFSTKDANFLLTGNQALAKAATKGWAIETEAVEGAASSLEVTLDNEAKVIGLVDQKSEGTYNSSLDMNVKNNAVWQLAPKENETEQRSRLAVLNLESGGGLDAATNLTDGTKAEYFIKMTSNGVDNDEEFTNIGGIITLANQSYEDVLTIEGNYFGNSGKLKVNTLWNSPGDENGANSKSDLLVITGNASGNTNVIAVKADGTENVIDGNIASIAADLNANSSVVVKVLGVDAGETEAQTKTKSSGNIFEIRPTFTGTAATSGAGELQLASRKNEDGTTEYYWTITVVNPEKPIEPENPIVPENPEKPTEPNKPAPIIPIYNPAVPAYVQMPKVNLDLGYSTLATLHERRGENQIVSWDKYVAKSENKDQLWARLLKENKKEGGKNRFEYKTDIDGVQVGNDFRVDYDGKGGYRLTGAYFAYAKADSKFYDRYKSENGKVVADKFTGDGESENFALGLTSTKYFADGAYFDLVGQVSYIRNEYKTQGMDKVKQKGSGVALSAEVGQPYELSAKENSNWNIEPQAQLIYQTLKLEDFNDGVRHVDDNRQIAFRGRIGARLTYNKHGVGDKVGTKTFYGIANIWQDFLRNNGTKIGADRVKEKYARTTGEVGLGVQLPISDSSYVYTDLRYEHSLGGRKVRGYRGTVGLKYTW